MGKTNEEKRVPFKTCKLCGRGFSKCGTFKRHLLVHKEYSCSEACCGEKFRKMSLLKRHQKTAHLRKQKKAEYLIVQPGAEIPEECVMCYERLCPLNFTVNTQTFDMTTKCTCGLTIIITHRKDPTPAFSKPSPRCKKRK